jgi:hypothetical protein
MRRSYLIASLAGAIALFTTGSLVVVSNRASKIESFKTKLSELTFCKTAYEIASSHPSYISRFVEDERTKEELLKESELLNSKKEKIDLLIDQHIKEAAELPLDDISVRTLIDKTTWDAELEAVQAAGWVEEHEAFLDQIDEICKPYFK